VVPIREQTTASVQLPVDGTRDANAEPLHAARERAAIRSFSDEMQMVALHREVNETEAKSFTRTRESGSHPLEERIPSERRHTAHNL
jgi:hypothetical protein